MPVPTVILKGPALAGIAPDLTAAHLKALPMQPVRLGRIRPRARPMALGLAHYLDVEKLKAVLPASVDYTQKAMASLSRMYMNDQLGCCVISGKFHAVGLWSGNDTGSAVVGTDGEIVSSYHGICGPGDNGCVITDVLDYMRTRGLPLSGRAHKIDGYVQCDWRRQDLVKAALYLFGALTIGINLPEAWTSAAVWDVTSSQIVGGHDVTCVAFNSQGVQISSWGRVYTITWPAFTSTRWLEECYVLLGPDWTGDDRLAPSGVNVDALVADLQKISGGQVPDIDPGPAPPAPPTPPGPTPPGPAPAKLLSLNFPHIPRGGWVGAWQTRVEIPAGKYDLVPSQAAGESPDLTYPVEVSES